MTWLAFVTCVRPRIVVVKPRRSVGSGVGDSGAREADASGEADSVGDGAADGAADSDATADADAPADADGGADPNGEADASADADAEGANVGDAEGAGMGVGVEAKLGAGVGSVSTGPGVRSVSHTYLLPVKANVPCGPECEKNRK
jgi:hypothetical protein